MDREQKITESAPISEGNSLDGSGKPLPAGDKSQLGFSSAVDCIRNLFEEFRDGRGEDGKYTVVLRSDEYQTFRQVKVSMSHLLKSHTALVKALESCKNVIDMLAEEGWYFDNFDKTMGLQGEIDRALSQIRGGEK